MAKVSAEDWGNSPQPLTLQLLRGPSAVPAEKRAELLATVHEQLVPELIVAHWQELQTLDPCSDTRGPPTEGEVSELARIARRQDLSGALAFIETLVRQGVPLEVVLLHLIAPAARLLGDEWLADQTSWGEVTIGLGTLQQVVHVFGPRFSPEAPDRGLVVLAAAPREQHTLGLYVLAEFLRRAGWDVQVDPAISDADLIALVESTHVELIGISVSNTDLVPSLDALVAAIRRASRNPQIAVALGGALDLSEEAERLGAVCFPDPRDVVRWLDDRARVG
ncbi:MAG TPA: cobalamin B12-binding domain-containing protein [Polyangiaceae bacterium]|nr:cobalamin B12-binding domain-containing protein [Polyangiaceae bacterium]